MDTSDQVSDIFVMYLFLSVLTLEFPKVGGIVFKVKSMFGSSLEFNIISLLGGFLTQSQVVIKVFQNKICLGKWPEM